MGQQGKRWQGAFPGGMRNDATAGPANFLKPPWACMRKGLPRAFGLLLSSTAAACAASAAAATTATKHPVLFLGAPLIRKHLAATVSGHCLGPAPRTTLRSLVSTSLPARRQQEEQGETIQALEQQQVELEDDVARAAQQSKGKDRQSSKAQSARGKKGAAAKAKKRGTEKEQSAQLPKGTRMQRGQKQEKPETAPGTPRRSTRKTAGGGAKKAKPSTTEKRGQGRKSVEDLVPDVEEMANKIGVQLPKGQKKKQEAKAAIAKTSDRPYRDYSKQGALEELKKTHKVTKKGGTEKGDPFSGPRRSPRSKRGVNAPPSPAEKKKHPTRRRTKRGTPSARSKLANEANRPLADALYELADFVLHGDTTQKGIAYQKAAKSVREAPKPIKSKDDARKLVGVGQSMASKIQEFVSKGSIKVLEEYRRGERGK